MVLLRSASDIPTPTARPNSPAWYLAVPWPVASTKLGGRGSPLRGTQSPAATCSDCGCSCSCGRPPVGTPVGSDARSAVGRRPRAISFARWLPLAGALLFLMVAHLTGMVAMARRSWAGLGSGSVSQVFYVQTTTVNFEQPGQVFLHKYGGGSGGTAIRGLSQQQAAGAEHAVAAATTAAAAAGQQLPPRRQRRCAIYNNLWWHIDVAAGMAWAFQEAGCSVTCYLHKRSRGMQDVMAGWYRGGYQPNERMVVDAPQFDVVVVVTYTEASVRFGMERRLLEQRQPTHQRFLLLVHNPDEMRGSRWLAGGMLPAGQQQQQHEAAGHQQQEQQHEAAGHQQQQRLQRGQVQRELQQQGTRRLPLSSSAAALGAGSTDAPGSSGCTPLPAPPPVALPRVQLATLSPCVSAYMHACLLEWPAAGESRSGNGGGGSGGSVFSGQQLQVPWIAPLVPWHPSTAKSHDFGKRDNSKASSGSGSGSRSIKASGGGGGGSSRASLPGRPQGQRTQQHLCIQGSIQAHRRNYAAAFAAASHPAVLAQLRRRGEALLLVGSDKGERLEVPPPLTPYVKVAADLPFQEFWDTLARCRAILTAFASDTYLTNKSSSTVATAIHVGVPLVAEDRVLAAYTYLHPDAVFSFTQDRPTLAASQQQWGAEQQQQPMKRKLAAAAAGGMPGSSLSEGGVLSGGGGSRQPLSSGSKRWRLKLHAGAAGRKGGGGASGSSSSGTDRWGRDAGAEQRQQQRLGGLGMALPRLGSYPHALLLAFDDDASAAAHAAMRRLKREIMAHNVGVAAGFLGDTAAAAAAAAVPASAESAVAAAAGVAALPDSTGA